MQFLLGKKEEMAPSESQLGSMVLRERLAWKPLVALVSQSELKKQQVMPAGSNVGLSATDLLKDAIQIMVLASITQQKMSSPSSLERWLKLLRLDQDQEQSSKSQLGSGPGRENNALKPQEHFV